MPVALSPNAVPTPSAPMTGGVVKQEALKYPCNFDSIDPEFMSWLLEQVPLNCARSPLIPKTFVTFVLAMVSALPDWMVRTEARFHPPMIVRPSPVRGAGKSQVSLRMNR